MKKPNEADVRILLDNVASEFREAKVATLRNGDIVVHCGAHTEDTHYGPRVLVQHICTKICEKLNLGYTFTGLNLEGK